MKNRRNLIVAFLLCACLIVGIGYAAVADELVITGTGSYEASLNPFDADVYFTRVVSQGKGITATVTPNTDSATFDVKFNSQDASTYDSNSNSVYMSTAIYEFTYVVDNAEDNGATSATFSAPELTINPGNGWTVVATICDANGTNISANKITLTNNEVGYVKVVCSYNIATGGAAGDGAVTTNFTVNVPVASN